LELVDSNDDDGNLNLFAFIFCEKKERENTKFRIRQVWRCNQKGKK